MKFNCLHKFSQLEMVVCMMLINIELLFSLNLGLGAEMGVPIDSHRQYINVCHIEARGGMMGLISLIQIKGQ